MTETQKNFIQAMIDFIKDSPIGAESLEGYIADTDNIHREFNEFISSMKDILK